MTCREYDFIIVGGGSAGCLLARRLVESNSGSVALVEAGEQKTPGHADVRTVVPAFYPRTFGSRLDWAYSTEPQPGLNGRRIAWPRGKTLGGSGAINALIYMQATEDDFDRWSKMGCEGWDWASIESSLKLDSQSTLTCPASRLQTREIAEPHPWSQAFVEACESYGFRRKKSWLQAEGGVCGFYSLTQRDGRRHHTGQQIAEVSAHTNLDIYPGMMVRDLQIVGDRVEKIWLVDGSNKVVELHVGGEVILCAGAIGSPSILLRSGIGPADALRKLGIRVARDLPGVGENLQDHLMYPLVYRTSANDGMPTRFSVANRQSFRLQKSATGYSPLASNIAEAGAMFGPGITSFCGRDAKVEQSGASTEYQIHFTPTHYLKYPARNAPMDCFTLAVNDLHPRSRGQLKLVSADPNDAPRIDPSYLQNVEDAPRLLFAIEIGREIANQASLGMIAFDELMPGRKRSDVKSMLRSLQLFAQSIYHPVGTCRMGIDSQAVVDAELRVHGFRNLHVADASVLPDLPSANTQAVTLLVAARKFVRLTR